MVDRLIKDSCILVYTDNRIGKPVSPCLDNTTTNHTPKGRNKIKFSKNGCRKVNRETDCSLELLRG